MRRLLSIFLVLASLALLGSCEPTSRPMLRLGTNVWVGYEPLYLARSLGHYDQEPIRLVEHTATTYVMRSLLEGELEAAAVTLDEALSLISQGLDLKVVLIFDASAGADAVVARPGITHLAHLKGKRVGVESGAVGALMFTALLQASGLRLEDITRVPITANQQVSSYTREQVDAVVAFEPAISQLRALGGHVLLDSRAIPGRILDVLVVRADALQAHGDTLKTLLRGYFAALEYQRAHPVDAHTRMSARLGENVAAQLAGIHQPEVAENHASLAHLDAQAREFADFLVAQGLLPRPPALQGLADPGYLPR